MNQNQLKKIASLSHGKYRKIHGLFLVEGAHAVSELLKSSWQVETIIITHLSGKESEIANILKAAITKAIPVDTLNQQIFEKLATTDTPQGIMAVARLWFPDPAGMSGHQRVLIADGISDPGNLGTMIRTAAAFGFDSLLTTPGSADIFSPKTVRAAQGALFSLIPYSHINPSEFIDRIKTTHSLIALTAQANSEIQDLKKSSKMALIVGAEIRGIGETLLNAADFKVRIPISKEVESLNAAIAAGIAMFALRR